MKWREMFDWWLHKAKQQEAEESRERLDASIHQSSQAARRLQTRAVTEVRQAQRVLAVAEDALRMLQDRER